MLTSFGDLHMLVKVVALTQLKEATMALFIISYDLIKYKDYPKLWEALKNNNAHRVLDSVWVMSANTTPRDMAEWLKQYVDSDDKIFVAKN